ncbi:PilN domain-containing protein [Chlorogloeopsis sp. ULAP01]|uniref:PilN domain-containing protein n=1 Tax=Chlorogloeopsis sp. ULAP01 TaxID=3056483 RepID=UPI0025AB07FC|nr:PilN domain-containing protein [Chlorogloeopsis sp. ULAP01]MDM9380773.1 PilN domain-containing protein [Chlorogloeopsis sp. ULAP01]
MYSLEINFLNDRPGIKRTNEKRAKPTLPVGNFTPVYIGVGLGLIFPLLVGVGWWFLQAKNAELEQQVAQLEQENKNLEVQIGSINKIKEETNRIKEQTQSLVSVFDQIRPWSAMLQELRDRIPATVQIQNIRQMAPVAAKEGQQPTNPAGGIEINGVARSFNDVNDFLLVLQQSPFFKPSEAKIVSAELVETPLSNSQTGSASKKTIQMVKYTLQSAMSDVPASELIRELEQKGTVGLVTRIRNLQKTGVIQK